MGGLSLTHLLIVLIIALLLFGAGRVSEIGKGLGEGIRNFKKGLKDDDAPAPAPSKRRLVEIDEDEAPRLAAPKKRMVEVEEDEPVRVVAAPKKKKVIQIEVDDDEDEE